MSLEIVTSHWKEDLTWLLKSPWPVNLIDKEGADPSPFVPKHIIPNKGREVSAYMKYIIENYNNLPDYVAFIHGHEFSEHTHHDKSLLDIIGGANIHNYHFIPLNNLFKFYNFFQYGDDIIPFISFWFIFGFYDVDSPKLYSGVIAPMSAQFIVSREAIRRYNKSQWTQWYNLVSNEQQNDYNLFAVFFEHIWHMILAKGRYVDPTLAGSLFPQKNQLIGTLGLTRRGKRLQRVKP
jgi:hypothetical protein